MKNFRTKLLAGLALIFLTLGCSNVKSEKRIFHRLADQETVSIYLSKYDLDSVPPAIGDLAKVRRLSITKDSTSGWNIYPPLSAFRLWIERPPFRHLPAEITKLKTLRKLDLVYLDLVDLPDDFDSLQNLDSLDLSLNKLTIANEVDVINGLRRLKYLALFGNKVDTADVVKLKQVNPNLVVVF
ncbi:MAG: leucine-rich repeat domain-containing protein [Chryseolinea sp.]